MATKESIRAKLRYMEALYDQARKLGDQICKELGDEAGDDFMYDLLNDVADGTPGDEAFDTLEDEGYLDDLDDGEEITIPKIEINAANPIYSSLKISLANGGYFEACTGRSDSGTYQAALLYWTPKGDPIDLTFVEMKRGELAEAVGKPARIKNQDIDIVVFPNPFEEDETKVFTLTQEEIETALKGGAN